MNKRSVLLVALVAAVAVAGCTSGTEGNVLSDDQDRQSAAERPPVNLVLGATPDQTLRLTNNRFSRESLSVSEGAVVRFVNDEGRHTVTVEGEGVDTTLSEGGRATLRFNEEGTYEVYCKFHGSPDSGMHTEIQVG